MKDMIGKEETYEIVGAAIEVANELGCGFLEAVYQEALAIELAEKGIPFKEQVKLKIPYKGKILQKEYIPDFICYENILVEIKAINKITSQEEAQMLNYLKASKMPLGILVNFGSTKLEWKRMILSHD